MHDMQSLVCLDMEGVLTPEIWQALATRSGIEALRRTTKEEPDYDALMRFRLEILRREGIGIEDIRTAVRHLEPLPGAVEFLDALRADFGVVVLSDTFAEFAMPLVEALGRPFILCNSLTIDSRGLLVDYRLRQENGKKRAVEAFQGLNLFVVAAGDSHNDLPMIRAADAGILFRAPDAIVDEYPDLPHATDYSGLRAAIQAAVTTGSIR